MISQTLKNLETGIGVAKQSAGKTRLRREPPETIRGSRLRRQDIVHVRNAPKVRPGPEVSVIRRKQALSGFIGRKVCVGGPTSRILNTKA